MLKGRRAAVDAMDVRLFPVREALSMELAFDHRQILEDALVEIRKQMLTTTIAKEFLPKEFTISELYQVTKLMVLWIFVKLNVISADILSFIQPGFMKGLVETGTAEGLVITPAFLVIAAILLEVNIAMILVSRLASYRINRWLNIIAPIIVAAFIIGGGSLAPHYIFFATIEVITLLIIMRLAIQWKESQ
jgi:hypothetical protein